jgi:hypothetical protein
VSRENEVEFDMVRAGDCSWVNRQKSPRRLEIHFENLRRCKELHSGSPSRIHMLHQISSIRNTLVLDGNLLNGQKHGF